MLALEPEIVARLQAELGATVHVLTAAALGDLQGGKSRAPALYVIYRSGSVGEAEDYRRVLIRQRWWVVCVARYVDPIGAGAGARASAGALARSAFHALHAWSPTLATRPMLLSALPAAEYLAGYQLIPLEFDTELTLETP